MQRTYLRIPGLVALASIFALGCNDDSTNTENADEIGTDGTTIGDGDGDPTAETGTSAETSATDTGTTDPTATDTATTDPTTDTATTDPTTDTATTDATTTTTTTDEGTFCQPGFTQCVDAQSFETCLGDGSAFGDPEACDPNATCIAGAWHTRHTSFRTTPPLARLQ